MRDLVLITLFGGVGSLCRYGIGEWAISDAFPWATLGINAIGSLALGVVVGLHAAGKLPMSGRLAMGTGFCGGFTTFSTFSVEAIALLQKQQTARAAGYIAASVLLGLVGASLGLMIARALAPAE